MRAPAALISKICVSEAALAVVEKHPAKIDVVVADIVMPRMGDPELVEKLRAKRDDFAVIFMTGYIEAPVLRERENPEAGRSCSTSRSLRKCQRQK